MDIENQKIKCPVCGSSTDYIEKKKLLFGKSKKYICQRIECLTELNIKEHGLELKRSKQINNEIWNKYKFQTLTFREWNRIAEGGISDKEQEEKDRILVLDKIKNGEVNLRFINEVPIILKKNEVPYIMIPSVEFHEDRMVRHAVGGAVRVMKGVYLGGTRSESHPERRHIDTGSLILTNKRLVFSGSRKGIDVDLRKIISIDPYKDGIAVNRSNKKNTEWFIGGMEDISLSMQIEERSQSYKLDGLILKYMIESAISKMG
ncbi:MAG: hypothetical protein PHH85_05995 [Candidatus Methanoperedens sp.]|nr:hypothetical protein [Candidatus Methanoperedens sp.]